MFHKAIDLEFKEGTVLQVTFQTGEVKQFDMAVTFTKYPALEALKDRELFRSGHLMGSYGIVWNDELDIEAETIYEEGKTVDRRTIPNNVMVGNAVLKARANAGVSQKELANATGIDQSDISKIERGIANPSINTLKRIANALDMELTLTIA